MQMDRDTGPVTAPLSFSLVQSLGLAGLGGGASLQRVAVGPLK